MSNACLVRFEYFEKFEILLLISDVKQKQIPGFQCGVWLLDPTALHTVFWATRAMQEPLKKESGRE